MSEQQPELIRFENPIRDAIREAHFGNMDDALAIARGEEPGYDFDALKASARQYSEENPITPEEEAAFQADLEAQEQRGEQ